jgi:uncharacterized protein (DUF4415 family)
MKKSADSTVKLTLDPNNPPKLTDEQQARLAAVAAMPDDQIDYSDAPELPDAFWVAAEKVGSANKAQVTLRLDAEVLAFFKETGRRYQTRINAVLVAYVEAQKKAHHRS